MPANGNANHLGSRPQFRITTNLPLNTLTDFQPGTRLRSRCCARAANGQAAADPATPLMRSRRRIARPEAQDYAKTPDYIRDLPPVKWGSEAWLHGSKFELRMSPTKSQAYCCFFFGPATVGFFGLGVLGAGRMAAQGSFAF